MGVIPAKAGTQCLSNGPSSYPPPMRVPVLTYHSNNIHGNDYAHNDHVALEHDLATIARLGYRIVPLAKVVEALDDPQLDLDDAVAITFDDGSWFDWHDLEHPSCGPQ